MSSACIKVQSVAFTEHNILSVDRYDDPRGVAVHPGGATWAGVPTADMRTETNKNFLSTRTGRETAPMSLTILYHNPARPDEAGMTLISGQAEAGGVLDRLDTRGFVVDKITLGPVRAHAAAVESPT